MALVAGAGALGCSAPAQVASTGPQTPRPASAETIGGPFVQAGVAFGIRMDAPIDTFYTAAGTPFTGTVVNPLMDNTGRTVVAYGAKVHGTVEGAGTGDHPRLRVQIDSIDTTSGTLPIQASVRHAEHFEWSGPARVLAESNSWDADTYLNPNDVAPGFAPSGGLTTPTGTPYYGEIVRQPQEVRVPQNALVQLVLVRPLVLRGAPISSR